jgi:hypothetical protein
MELSQVFLSLLQTILKISKRLLGCQGKTIFEENDIRGEGTFSEIPLPRFLRCGMIRQSYFGKGDEDETAVFLSASGTGGGFFSGRMRSSFRESRGPEGEHREHRPEGGEAF